MTRLVVDTREPRQIYDFLRKSAPGAKIEYSAHSTGDYWIIRDDAPDLVETAPGDPDAPAQKRPSVIVERKTWSDLASSIIDSRWETQKEDLHAFADKGVAVIILVEGDAASQLCRMKIKPEFLKSALVDLETHGRIKVHYTEGISDTAAFLFRLCSSVERGPRTFGVLYKEQKGKSTFEKKDYLWRCLGVIPGIGTATAQIVAAEFPSISDIALRGRGKIRSLQRESGTSLGKKAEATLLSYCRELYGEPRSKRQRTKSEL